MTNRRVRSDGIELGVTEHGRGDGPPVLLVHGYPDTSAVWHEVATRLAPSHHVITYDVRGAGTSTAPADIAGYDLDCLVDDALAVLEATCGERPAHVVGHDWGSVQGWELATSPRARGRVASFTSISGPSLDQMGHWIRRRLRQRSARGFADLVSQVPRSTYVLAFRLPGVPHAVWRLAAPRWPDFLRRQGIHPGGGHPAPTLQRDGVNGANLYRRNVRRRLRRPRVDPVAHAPVQLVVPGRDPFVSPRVYDDLDRWVPQLRRRHIDAGHWVPRSHPDELAALIAGFVADVDAGRAVAP